MPLSFFRRRRATAGPAVGGTRPPCVPAGQRLYVVGDIHGRLDLLDRMLDLIARDAAAARGGVQHTLVFLGDYVDRGPDSAGVVDRLCAGPPLPGFGSVCLKGNHEERMLLFLTDVRSGAAWLRFGGRECLGSYGVRQPAGQEEADWLPQAQAAFRAALPPGHLAFLRALRLSLRVGDYLFVHAGIRPGVPLDRQDAEDLLWIREPFLSSDADHGAVIVHGHTIRTVPETLSNRIGIDTGAYESGRLSCLVLEGTDRRFLGT